MDKIRRYLGRVVIDLEYLFDQFILQFGWFALNRRDYIQLAEIFLNVSTPEAIMYGKYITHQNDHAIYGQQDSRSAAESIVIESILDEAVKPKPTECSSLKRQPSSDKKPIKTKRSKKAIISQDAAPGNNL